MVVREQVAHLVNKPLQAACINWRIMPEAEKLPKMNSELRKRRSNFKDNLRSRALSTNTSASQKRMYFCYNFSINFYHVLHRRSLGKTYTDNHGVTDFFTTLI